MMLRLVHTLLICFALLHATSATGMPAPAQNPSPTKNQSIPDPCGRFGKLFSAAVGMTNSFEQDTLVRTRVLTDTGYQTRLKPIKDIAVGDEVLAWDEVQAHDNAALAIAGQAPHTLQAAYQQRSAQNNPSSPNSAVQANLPIKSADSPSKCCTDSYENNSDSSIVNHASISAASKPTSAQRYEKVTDIASSFKEQTLLHITLDNGQTIQATAGHPFKTREGWRDAVMLKKGGKLLLRGGDANANSDVNSAERYATITDIREEVKTTAVFNLEVANLHTFFVGEDGLVVHNGYTPPPEPGRPTPVNTGGAFQPGRGSGHYKYHKQANCKGYLDKFGDIWEPTDHSGTHDPHWDRQHPNGKHTPTYPTPGGGRRR
jgi:hypothetical protein